MIPVVDDLVEKLLIGFLAHPRNDGDICELFNG